MLARRGTAAGSEANISGRVWPGAARRAVLAGIGWGVPMAALFVALDAWHCGALCLTDAAFTLAIATMAGISTIGVFAAYFGGTAPAFAGRRNLRQKGTSWHVRSSLLSR
jgi:hypothetical protein